MEAGELVAAHLLGEMDHEQMIAMGRSTDTALNPSVRENWTGPEDELHPGRGSESGIRHGTWGQGFLRD